MDVIVQRPAALDVHKEQVTACVRYPTADGSRADEVREFKTTVGGLLVLHDWLKAHGVTHVAMEATGVYCPGSRDPRNTHDERELRWELDVGSQIEPVDRRSTRLVVRRWRLARQRF